MKYEIGDKVEYKFIKNLKVVGIEGACYILEDKSGYQKKCQIRLVDKYGIPSKDNNETKKRECVIQIVGKRVDGEEFQINVRTEYKEDRNLQNWATEWIISQPQFIKAINEELYEYLLNKNYILLIYNHKTDYFYTDPE